MNSATNQISEDFAKQLLQALYKFDLPVGSLDMLISKVDDAELKEALLKIASEFMNITLNELMIPIYRCHPSLGHASRPGTWLINDKE